MCLAWLNDADLIVVEDRPGRLQHFQNKWLLRYGHGSKEKLHPQDTSFNLQNLMCVPEYR